MPKLACSTSRKQEPDLPCGGLISKVCSARVPFLRPSLAQVPAEESVAQVMGWLRRTFGRQGIEVPEPLEVLLTSCCLLHVPYERAMKLCHAGESGMVVDQLGMPVACMVRVLCTA